MARMAPSEVDIEAAQMPISTQQPNQVGIFGFGADGKRQHVRMSGQGADWLIRTHISHLDYGGKCSTEK